MKYLYPCLLVVPLLASTQCIASDSFVITHKKFTDAQVSLSENQLIDAGKASVVAVTQNIKLGGKKKVPDEVCECTTPVGMVSSTSTEDIIKIADPAISTKDLVDKVVANIASDGKWKAVVFESEDTDSKGAIDLQKQLEQLKAAQ